MHLAWDWPAPEPIASTAGDSSSGPDTAASAAGLEAGSGAGPEDGLLPGSDEIQGVVAGSRPESAAVPDASNAAASKRPSSTSSTKLARGSSAKGAAGQSKNIKASAAGSTPAAAAAASQAGAKQAAAKARPSVSAGSAAGKKSARGDSGSGTEAAAAVEQHEAGSTTTAAAATGEGMPAPTGANPGGPPGSEEATAAAMAGAKHFDLLSVVGCDDMLPPGGPSSLLETFKRAISPATDTAAGQEGAGSPTAEAPAAAAAGISSVVATSLFSITPAACVIPAGSQQQFVVSFCSSEPRVVQHLALQGRQTLCWPKGSAGQGGCLKVHMLPGARGHAAEGKPMQCHITGTWRQLCHLQAVVVVSVCECTRSAQHQSLCVVAFVIRLFLHNCAYILGGTVPQWTNQRLPLLPDACRRLPPACRAATQAHANADCGAVSCGSCTTAVSRRP